jgi:ribose 5-phosphate isomerase B
MSTICPTGVETQTGTMEESSSFCGSGVSGERGGLMRIGMAADHWGFGLKERLGARLVRAGHQVVDFGAREEEPEDDFPDYVIPLARSVAAGDVQRGVAICGSGVGACVAANKVAGVRAALISDTFSARQGVEDDDMNLLCLGSRVVDEVRAWALLRTFLVARYSGAERFERRLAKIAALERSDVV